MLWSVCLLITQWRFYAGTAGAVAPPDFRFPSVQKIRQWCGIIIIIITFHHLLLHHITLPCWFAGLLVCLCLILPSITNEREEKNSTATRSCKWRWLWCTQTDSWGQRDWWRHRERMFGICCTAEEYWSDDKGKRKGAYTWYSASS